LFAPKIGGDWILSRRRCAVNSDHAKGRQRQHREQKGPVQAEELPKKRGHVDRNGGWILDVIATRRLHAEFVFRKGDQGQKSGEFSL
jgi:hypothetical protein